MSSSPAPPPLLPQVTSAGGLAIASLVSGLLAALLGVLVIGGVFGVAGLVLGLLHVRRRTGRNGMAWWGFGLSLAGILVSVLAGTACYLGYRQFKATPGGGTALEEWRGVAAPDLSVTTLEGARLTLSELRGKRVVLDFWATWCPPCREEIPHFIRLHEDTSRDDLVIVGISSEQAGTLRPFVEQNGVNYPIASAKGRLPRPYSDVRAIPTTFFIDRRGIILHVAVGYHDFAALQTHALAEDYEGQPKPPPKAGSGLGPGASRVASAAIARAGAPIPLGPDSRTWRDFIPEHSDWTERRVIRPFAARAKGEPWGDDAVAFLREVGTWWFGVWRDSTEEPRYLERGEALLKAGCDDPLIRFIVAWLTFQIHHDWLEVLEDCERAVAEFDQRGTPPAAARLAGVETTILYKRARKDKRLAALDKWITRWTRQAIEAGDYAGEDAKILAHHVLLPGWDDHLERNPEAIEALFREADVAEWLRCAVLGAVETKKAWRDRGAGWAYKVTEEGWRGFFEHLGKAAPLLRRSWELRPDCPQAASKMIAVVMGGGGEPGETERLWFDRAVAAQFDYAPAYHAMAWALRPRWGGSHEEMLAFGRACLCTKRFDTLVPLFYLEILNDICKERKDWRTLYRDPQIAREVMDLNRALLEAPTRKQEIPGRLSQIVVNGWLCGDLDEARRALERLDGGLLPNVDIRMAQHGIDRAVMLGDIALSGDPVREDVALAGRAARSKSYAEALRRFRDARARCQNDCGRRFIDSRIDAILIEQELGEGGWVDITPKGTLRAWSVLNGRWEADDAGGIINHGDDGRGTILSHVDPGRDFELRGSFRVDAPKDCCQGLGIALGFRKGDDGADEENWLTCAHSRTERGTPWATCMNRYRWDNETQPLARPGILPDNTFLVRVRDGKVTYVANGKTVFEDHVPEEIDLAAPGNRFGFTWKRFCRYNTTTITRIELRRLGRGAPQAAEGGGK